MTAAAERKDNGTDTYSTATEGNQGRLPPYKVTSTPETMGRAFYNS